MVTSRCFDWFNNHWLSDPIGYIPSDEAEANYYPVNQNFEMVAQLN